MASDRERIRTVDEVLHPKPKPQKTTDTTTIEWAKMPAEYAFPESIIFEWSPDGSLKEAVTSTERMSFVWNSNGTLDRIIKEKVNR